MLRVQLYALGMLCCGYAAGQLHPVDWTGLPWWHGLIVGGAMLVAAGVLEFRAGKR